MGAPRKVHIRPIQDRRSHGKRSPWVVRWTVGKRSFSEAFRLRAQADAYRSRLMSALTDGATFDPTTGRPEAWDREQLSVAAWAKRWVDMEWRSWAPRSRRAAVEAVSTALPILCSPRAPSLTDEAAARLRAETRAWLAPGDAPMPEHLRRWSLQLETLDAAVCRSADAELTTRQDGRPMAATTASRYRITVRAMLAAAVSAGVLAEMPWPRTSRRRTSQKISTPVDVRLLPDPSEAVAAIERIVTDQPGSRGYRVLCYLVYLAGLRPGEARALHVEDLTLPPAGWGAIEVHRALKDAGDSYTAAHELAGPTKTGVRRRVPIPPVLVSMLREWVGERQSGLLVQTRSGGPVSHTNLSRAWRRARGDRDWRLYDLRHACATQWIHSGVSIGNVAERLGHGPEVTLSVYLGAMKGDEDIANERISAYLATWDLDIPAGSGPSS
jgi:integrase